MSKKDEKKKATTGEKYIPRMDDEAQMRRSREFSRFVHQKGMPTTFGAGKEQGILVPFQIKPDPPEPSA